MAIVPALVFIFIVCAALCAIYVLFKQPANGQVPLAVGLLLAAIALAIDSGGHLFH